MDSQTNSLLYTLSISLVLSIHLFVPLGPLIISAIFLLLNKLEWSWPKVLVDIC